MNHAMHHTLLGFCWWDLPALIILIGIIVFLIVRHSKLKRYERELQDAIDEKAADGNLIDE
ncbi:MAG: hypothetical protein PUB75_01135 [Firmicutes bacterium]|nr:hypothetical protein [Bacillota bacterium]